MLYGSLSGVNDTEMSHLLDLNPPCFYLFTSFMTTTGFWPASACMLSLMSGKHIDIKAEVKKAHAIVALGLGFVRGTGLACHDDSLPALRTVSLPFSVYFLSCKALCRIPLSLSSKADIEYGMPYWPQKWVQTSYDQI